MASPAPGAVAATAARTVPVPATPLPNAATINAPELVVAGNFHSSWVSQSENVTVTGGETTTLTVRFRNTGTANWVLGIPGQQANLALSGDGASLSSDWLSADRVAIQSEALVPPGGIGTFSFDVRAPAADGTYRLDVRPVIDGTTWMEDEGVFFTLTTQAFESAYAVAMLMSYASTLIMGLALLLLLLLVLVTAKQLARMRRGRSVSAL